MKKVDTGQLSFAFADSPQGGDRDKVSDVSEAKAWLLLIAKGKEAKESAARVLTG